VDGRSSFLALTALCVLGGCGTQQPLRIPYSGGDPASTQAAFAECRQQAMMSASAVLDPAQRTAAERSLERECMERRGYARR
jgi:predicted small lipoprotein YifL